MIKIRFFQFFILLILTGCGSGASKSSNDDPNANSSGLPSDLEGLLVFNQMSSLAFTGPRTVNSTGIFKLKLHAGKVVENKTITSGYYEGYDGYAYSIEKIIFLEVCGYNKTENLFKLFEKDGSSITSITACSDTTTIPRKFATAKSYAGQLSPDGSKLAAGMYYYNSSYERNDYFIIIYDVESGGELKRFTDYASPTWHPDGRLLMESRNHGLYLTNKDLTELSRIDNNNINLNIVSPDISPSGKKVVFSMANNIWVMDINGDNLKELIIGDAILSYPTWSPDEKYIAYFRYQASSIADDKLIFYKLDSREKFSINTNNIFSTNNGHYIPSNSPGGPLSWVK